MDGPVCRFCVISEYSQKKDYVYGMPRYLCTHPGDAIDRDAIDPNGICNCPEDYRIDKNDDR